MCVCYIPNNNINNNNNNRYAFSDNVENVTLYAGPTDAFTVKAKPPNVESWNSASCGLVSTSSLLTIRGLGFYSAPSNVIELTFNSSIIDAYVVNSTYSHITISFLELSAVSSGDMYATVSVPSSKCWEDLCSGVCLSDISASIANVNTTAKSCANTAMGSTCSYQCDDGYTASAASTCLRTTAWDTTSTSCENDCDTLVAPINGNLLSCVSETSMSSGSTCTIECSSGYSPAGTASCTDGVWDPSYCAKDCNSASFSAPTNGALGDCVSDLKHKETCSMVCTATGYTISGYSTCENGTLSTVSCLEDCDISSLVVPADATAGTCTVDLPSGNTCEISCDNSTIMSPSSNVTCTNGTLSTVTCVNKCLHTSFIAPSNGTLGGCTTTLLHGESCTMACNDGYTLSGPLTCSDGTLSSTPTCTFNSAYASACTLSSGFTDSTTTWYGCRDVDVDTTNAPYGVCHDTTGFQIPCGSTCFSDACTSSNTIVARIYPTAPTLVPDISNSIQCTEYAVTIAGEGFDHETPSNNVVILGAQDALGNDVTGFNGTCEVSEATRTRIVCVFTSLNCEQLDLDYYLLAKVAINTTSVDDAALFTTQCSNFGLDITAYTTAIVAKFAASIPIVTSYTQSITSSDNEITIYGCNFDILTPAANIVTFSSSYSTDIPTGIVTSASRSTGNVTDGSCTNNFGLIVVYFYKLGPTNIASPTDSDTLKASVYLSCNSTALCSQSVSFAVVATSITDGTISFIEDTSTIYTIAQNFTVFGEGFDPYTAGNNIVSFGHANKGTCGDLNGTVVDSSRTHLLVDIYSMSTAFTGEITVEAMTILGVVNETLGLGANLL